MSSKREIVLAANLLMDRDDIFSVKLLEISTKLEAVANVLMDKGIIELEEFEKELDKERKETKEALLWRLNK